MPWQRPMRWWRHAITDRADVARAFPPASLDRVERAIGEAEARHAGQIVFAVEPALPVARVLAKLPPRERALEVFGLRHLSATTTGIVSMIEPVIAATVAWVWLEETLSGVQLLGGLLVLTGVGLVQVARAGGDEPEPEPPLVGEATAVQ